MADVEFDIWDWNQGILVLITIRRWRWLRGVGGDIAGSFMRGRSTADDDLVPGDSTCAVNEEVFQ